MQTNASTPFPYPLLSRGILGGLFVGLGTTVLNLAFDLFYRMFTKYEFAQFININSIIFFTIPTLVVGGIVYAIIMEYVRKGVWVYTALCIALTLIVAFIPLGPYMLPTGEPMPVSARGLTLGIEIITGAMGAFALPYFAEHPKIWG
jgi:hypothetical protein